MLRRLRNLGAKQNTLGKFSFPSAEAVIPPSKRVAEIVWLLGVGRVLTGVALAAFVLDLVVGIALYRSASIIPYVADGGVFGCRADDGGRAQ